MFAHGLLGTLAYLGFFAHGLWRFRRDRTAVGIAGSAVVGFSLISMFWYNALVTPLLFMFLGYVLLASGRQPGAEARVPHQGPETENR